MNITFDCMLCKIYIELPLKQFKKQKDGGIFISGFKCINCGSKYTTIDLIFDKSENK